MDHKFLSTVVHLLHIYVCLVRAYSVYIHPAPFVRDAIFPYCVLLGSVHCCSRDKTSKTERLNSVGSQQGLEHGEEREAQLSRRKLIISVLRDTAAKGECSVYILKTAISL